MSSIQKSHLSWVLETVLEIVVSFVGFFCIIHYSECDTVIKIWLAELKKKTLVCRVCKDFNHEILIEADPLGSVCPQQP